MVTKARSKIDPIVTGLFYHALQGIADDAMLTLVRTSRSSLAKNAMDCSTGLLNVRGELLAAGLGDPKHTTQIQYVMPHVFARYPLHVMKLGDIYIVNDPHNGGTHLPDVFLIKPVLYQREIFAFAVACVHVPDIGGRVPGGNASDSTEIFQEGLRIPPMKFFDRSRPNESLLSIIDLNVRNSKTVIGDLLGEVSACRIAEQGLLKLVERYGLTRLRSLFDDLLDYSAELARAEYRTWPEGEFEFTDHIDGDGFDSGAINLHLKLTNRGGKLTLDFTGTSPQVKGSINSTLGATFHSVAMTIGTVCKTSIPQNHGVYRTIELIVPPKNFLNVSFPGAVAARGLSIMRVADVVWGAFSKMLPDRIFACSVGQETGVTIAGYYPEGQPFAFQEFLNVCWGGCPNMDGWDALSRPGLTHRNTPMEIIEREQPLRIEEYSIVPNSGGPGQYRGGMSLRRSYRLVGADEAIIQMRTDRQHILPYGLWGGKPGTPSKNTLNPGPHEQVWPAKARIPLTRGDVFCHITASGGGWGDPLERDPELCVLDVRKGRMTSDYVERQYGVVIDTTTLGVNWEATRELRGRMR